MISSLIQVIRNTMVNKGKPNKMIWPFSSITTSVFPYCLLNTVLIYNSDTFFTYNRFLFVLIWLIILIKNVLWVSYCLIPVKHFKTLRVGTKRINGHTFVCSVCNFDLHCTPTLSLSRVLLEMYRQVKMFCFTFKKVKLIPPVPSLIKEKFPTFKNWLSFKRYLSVTRPRHPFLLNVW